MGDSISSKQSSSAQKTWQMVNNVVDLDSAFVYDEEEQKNIRIAKPWEKDAHYFKEVKISAVALLKMVMHARRGGNIEVMGLMQGRVDAHSLIVTDSFALPVEGTETRVNAQAEANEYSVMYVDMCEAVARKDKVVGWYHSHPGYGCWLSGIDVSTQSLNQTYQEPFVAIVIDPIKTISAGKVEIGAFRTYPKGYKPPEESRSQYQSIPLNKVEDFGVHCKSYYSLDVTFFKSSLDSHILSSLWNTYWATTIASSPLSTNATYINDQLSDLGKKLQMIKNAMVRQSERSTETTEKLNKAVMDATFVGNELLNNLVVQNLKKALFNRTPCGCQSEAALIGGNEQMEVVPPEGQTIIDQDVAMS